MVARLEQAFISGAVAQCTSNVARKDGASFGVGQAPLNIARSCSESVGDFLQNRGAMVKVASIDP